MLSKRSDVIGRFGGRVRLHGKIGPHLKNRQKLDTGNKVSKKVGVVADAMPYLYP